MDAEYLYSTQATPGVAMGGGMRPCPFCGGEDISAPAVHWGGGGRTPRCNACGAEAPSVDRWNRRAPPPATARLLELARFEMETAVSSLADLYYDFVAEWPDAGTQTPRRDGRGG